MHSYLLSLFSPGQAKRLSFSSLLLLGTALSEYSNASELSFNRPQGQNQTPYSIKCYSSGNDYHGSLERSSISDPIELESLTPSDGLYQVDCYVKATHPVAGDKIIKHSFQLLQEEEQQWFLPSPSFSKYGEQQHASEEYKIISFDKAFINVPDQILKVVVEDPRYGTLYSNGHLAFTASETETSIVEIAKQSLYYVKGFFRQNAKGKDYIALGKQVFSDAASPQMSNALMKSVLNRLHIDTSAPYGTAENFLASANILLHAGSLSEHRSSLTAEMVAARMYLQYHYPIASELIHPHAITDLSMSQLVFINRQSGAEEELFFKAIGNSGQPTGPWQLHYRLHGKNLAGIGKELFNDDHPLVQTAIAMGMSELGIDYYFPYGTLQNAKATIAKRFFLKHILNSLPSEQRQNALQSINAIEADELLAIYEKINLYYKAGIALDNLNQASEFDEHKDDITTLRQQLLESFSDESAPEAASNLENSIQSSLNKVLPFIEAQYLQTLRGWARSPSTQHNRYKNAPDAAVANIYFNTKATGFSTAVTNETLKWLFIVEADKAIQDFDKAALPSRKSMAIKRLQDIGLNPYSYHQVKLKPGTYIPYTSPRGGYMPNAGRTSSSLVDFLLTRGDSTSAAELLVDRNGSTYDKLRNANINIDDEWNAAFDDNAQALAKVTSKQALLQELLTHGEPRFRILSQNGIEVFTPYSMVDGEENCGKLLCSPTSKKEVKTSHAYWGIKIKSTNIKYKLDMDSFELSAWNGEASSLSGENYDTESQNNSLEAFIKAQVLAHLNKKKEAYEDITGMTQAETFFQDFMLGLIPFYDAIKAGIEKRWGEMVFATTIDFISIAPGFGPAIKGVGKATTLSAKAATTIAKGSIRAGGKLFLKSGSTLFKGFSKSAISLGTRLVEDVTLGTVDLTAIRKSKRLNVLFKVDDALQHVPSSAPKLTISTSEEITQAIPSLRKYLDDPEVVRFDSASGSYRLRDDYNQEVIKIGDDFVPVSRYEGRLYLDAPRAPKLYEVHFDGDAHFATRGRLAGGANGDELLSQDELQRRYLTTNGYLEQLKQNRGSKEFADTKSDQYLLLDGKPTKQKGKQRAGVKPPKNNYNARNFDTVSENEKPIKIIDDLLEDLSPDGPKLTLWRAMPEAEAKALFKKGADETLEPGIPYSVPNIEQAAIQKHLGEYSYVTRIENGKPKYEGYLVKFTLKPNAQDILFSPSIAAIGKQGDAPKALAAASKYNPLHKGKRFVWKENGEGYVDGFIGLKSEDNKTGLSLTMSATPGTGLNESKQIFFKLVESVEFVRIQ